MVIPQVFFMGEASSSNGRLKVMMMIMIAMMIMMVSVCPIRVVMRQESILRDFLAQLDRRQISNKHAIWQFTVHYQTNRRSLYYNRKH